ncbi:ParA family protein [Chryseobacterium taklimakanense]|uniref:ParA family protein n=1 Tax=Chryseobacterium taklimakanense TaxID=536441 RepID=UPI001EF65432|nr:ParA family protein [Chryseobacterium taklimakanense]MCG7281605.1 ParA family protein [Chryseobacterium taklimakanense]
MIITFGTQKGGAGKTTLAIAFANYIACRTENTVRGYDFDFQKSFYGKWLEDEQEGRFPKLYDVEIFDEQKNQLFKDLDKILEMKESNEVYLFDMAGTLDRKYSDLLIYSDYIIIPFEYSDVSVKSTLVFRNFLGLIESESERIFIRSRYDKSYFYRNQEEMDIELSKYGILLKHPVYKRNILQKLNTRELSQQQKDAVRRPFDELLEIIGKQYSIEYKPQKKSEKC